MTRSITLHFLSSPSFVFVDTADIGESFNQLDLEAFRVEDEAMVPVAAELSEVLGCDVPAHQLISIDVDEAAMEVIYPVAQRLGLFHGLIVFRGNSGPLCDFSGVAYAAHRIDVLTSSAGTTWKQITASTIHQAILDCLLSPHPWVVISNREADQQDSEFGHSIALEPQDDGTVAVTRLGEVWSRRVHVDSMERAVELMLLFSDRCPALLALDWEVCEPERLQLMNPFDRAELPIRDLRVVERLAPGLRASIQDVNNGCIFFGRDREGVWEVIFHRSFTARHRATFATAEQMYEVVEAYLRGDMDVLRERLEVVPDAWDMGTISVTAMELPDRPEPWTQASVLEFHRSMLGSTAEPSLLMASFIDALNAKLGTEILLAEQHVEPAALVTLVVPVDVVPVTFERLIHLAEDRNISLVVTGDTVLYNPSGHVADGAESCSLGLYDPASAYARRWESFGIDALYEALWDYGAGFTLESRQSRSIPPAQRCSMSTSAEQGRFEVTLATPDAVYTEPDVSAYSVVHLFMNFAHGPHKLAQDVAWSHKQSAGEISPFPFTFHSNVYTPQPFAPESAPALIEAGLPAVGQWISIMDQVRQGDYCQVDRVGDESYLVEWGHDLGEQGCYQYTTADFADAVSCLVLFAREDRTEFEALEWTFVEA